MTGQRREFQGYSNHSNIQSLCNVQNICSSISTLINVIDYEIQKALSDVILKYNVAVKSVNIMLN